MAAGAGEEMVLVGRVVGEGTAPVLVHAFFHAGGERADYQQEGSLVLESGGRRLDVEIRAQDVWREQVEGRWGEVADTRLGKLFLDKAPGEHVKVRMSGGVLIPGDLIAVRAVAVSEAAAAGAGGYREAPDVVVTGIRALRAARGDDEASARAALEDFDQEMRRRNAKAWHEEEALRREEREKEAKAAARRAAAERAAQHPPEIMPWRWPFGLFMGGSLLSAAGTFALVRDWNGLFPASRGGGLWWGLTLLLFGAGVIAWTVRHDVPLVHEVGVSGRRRGLQLWAVVHLSLMAFVMPMITGGGRSKGTPVPWLGFSLIAGVPVILLVLTLVRTRPAVRRLWLILRARPLPPGAADGAWGLIEGTVGANEPLSARSTMKTEGKDDVIVTATLSERSFQLETAAGPVAVETARAIWSGPTVWRRQAGNPVAVSSVSPGERVAVLGRIRLGPEGQATRATGSESLFVIAGSPGRRLLRVLTPALAYLLFIAMIAVIVVISSV
jgi:hypothetical protein